MSTAAITPSACARYTPWMPRKHRVGLSLSLQYLTCAISSSLLIVSVAPSIITLMLLARYMTGRDALPVPRKHLGSISLTDDNWFRLVPHRIVHRLVDLQITFMCRTFCRSGMPTTCCPDVSHHFGVISKLSSEDVIPSSCK